MCATCRKSPSFTRSTSGSSPCSPKKNDKAILTQPGGGARLVLLQASKGHRIGQSCVKLIFDVADVPRFREEQARIGLRFGAIWRGPNYQFANARDPAKNLIQISDGFLADQERTDRHAPRDR
jgi:hypothetical protein